jgi:hypothetical protein
MSGLHPVHRVVVRGVARMAHGHACQQPNTPFGAAPTATRPPRTLMHQADILHRYARTRLLPVTGFPSASALSRGVHGSRLTVWRGQSPCQACGIRPCPRQMSSLDHGHVSAPYRGVGLVLGALAATRHLQQKCSHRSDVSACGWGSRPAHTLIPNDHVVSQVTASTAPRISLLPMRAGSTCICSTKEHLCFLYNRITKVSILRA